MINDLGGGDCHIDAVICKLKKLNKKKISQQLLTEKHH